MAIVLVLAIYVGLVSGGYWTHWPKTSDYYDQLATSFQHGQLALLTKPDPALLALPNPYDRNQRIGVPFLVDASLYKGRYYLYFGPMPAVLLALIKYIIPLHVADQYLVFVFIAGIFLLQSFLLIKIRRRFFSSLPSWMDTLAILAAGLIGPFTRMLVHPWIYEAALSGAQFFFLAGFSSAYLAFEKERADARWLSAAGIFWACAAATRATQLFAIAFMVLLILVWILRTAIHSKDFAASIKPIGALTLPLALAGVALAWYNYARFDSIFEFGLYYQLAYNLQSFYHTMFLRGYIPQNLYNYFFNPFLLSNKFPFLIPITGDKSPLVSFYNLPKPYVIDGVVTGLMYASPFIVFAILPPVFLAARWTKGKKITPNDREDSFRWITASLIGSFLATFIPLMMFFYVATRYEADFMPSLTLLALIGFWELCTWSRKKGIFYRALVSLGTTLAVISFILNTVVAFASHLTWFRIS
jgi:hypothetical protein